MIEPRKIFDKLDELEKAAFDNHVERVFQDPIDRKFTTLNTAARVKAIRDIRDELMALMKGA